MARDFKKIKAWQLADDLTVAVYGVTTKFPRAEIYGLTSQMRRASVSIAANIAEGANRGSKKEYLQFLSIAWGSQAETEYYVHLSRRLELLIQPDYERLDAIRRELAATLNGLVESVRSEAELDTRIR